MSTSVLSTAFNTLLAITLSLGLYLGAWAAVDVRNYIDMLDVHVADSVEGEPVNVSVDRVVYADFLGGYNVRIYRAGDNALECTSGDVDITYRVGRVLKDPLTLSFWSEGGSCTRLFNEGISAGKYWIETCHYVRRPLGILPPKERCVPSNPFTIHPRVE